MFRISFSLCRFVLTENVLFSYSVSIIKTADDVKKKDCELIIDTREKRTHIACTNFIYNNRNNVFIVGPWTEVETHIFANSLFIMCMKLNVKYNAEKMISFCMCDVRTHDYLMPMKFNACRQIMKISERE